MLFLAVGFAYSHSASANGQPIRIVWAIVASVQILLFLVARRRVVVTERDVFLRWSFRTQRYPVSRVTGFSIEKGAETIRLRKADTNEAVRTPLIIGVPHRRSPAGTRYDRMVARINAEHEHWIA